MGDISTASRQKLTNRKLQFMGGLAASCDGDLWPRQLTRFWDATWHVLDNKRLQNDEYEVYKVHV